MTGAELASMLTAALAAAGEPEAEVYATFAKRGFARFAVGELGQHMQLEDPSVVVRVARDRRVAEASCTVLGEQAIADAIRTAARTAPSVPRDEGFPGFAGPDEPNPLALARHSERTARASAEERVELLSPVFRRIRAAGLLATGVLDTTSRIEAVATSHGLTRSYESTLATFKVWALESAGGSGAAGHGMCAHVDLGALDLEAQTELAVTDALRSRNAGSLPAGQYDTVLGALALAELVEWLAMIGLGARELEQGLSPLSGRLGQRITAESFDLMEDPLGAHAFAAPFDREGVARRQVPLIRAGVAQGVVHDRTTAARAGVGSTGNASAPGGFGAGGPSPSSLVVQGGSAESVDELIGGIERGLYVRRLHYVNGYLEPRRAVMTGLSRDGTFLIEGGKVTKPIESMRFTDSLLEALERSDGMTRALTVAPNWWSAGGSVAAPAVRIRGLNFSSGSRQK
ncbi:MAG: TldD/PmbA family protein [Polyangiaceae bacterium]|nr:TldD/PmbA family protein [Polyangiaceae bacterium]